MRLTLNMIWKELTQVANRARFALGLSGLVMIVSGVFVFMAYVMLYDGSGGISPSAMAEFGRWFFWTSIALVALIVCGGALINASGIVVSEHAHRRLELLLVTPLSGASIVSAKAASVMARSGMGIMVCLPLYALLSIFGGVDAGMILAAGVFVVTNMWLYVAMGVFASVFGKTTLKALAGAAALFLLWNLLPLLYTWGLYMFLPEGDLRGAFNAEFSRHVFSLSPFYVFGEVLVDGPIEVWQLVSHAAVNVTLGAAFMAVSVACFRRRAVRLVAGPGARAKRWRLSRRGSSSTEANVPRPGRRFAALGEGMLARELSRLSVVRMLSSLTWFALLYVGIVLVSLATDQWPELDDVDTHAGLLLAELIPYMLILSAKASVRVARERERRTFQTVVLTRLGKCKILLTKAAAILIGDLPGIVFLVGHAVLVAAISPLSEPHRWVVVPGLVLALGFAVAVGMSFSLTARRVVGAVTATLLALVVAPYAAGLLNVMATLSLEELGFHQMAKPLAVTVIGVMALLAILLALWQGRSVGYRTPLYAACYVLLLAFGFAVVTALGGRLLGTSDANEVSFSVGMLLMPGLTTFGVFSHGRLAFAAVAGAMQVSIMIWCVASSLWSFEAQARRQ